MKVPTLASIVMMTVLWSVLVECAIAQQPAAPATTPEKKEKETPKRATEAPPLAPEKVDVQPVSNDTAIAERLTGILEATEWYDKPEVDVRQGVAFLSGETSTRTYRDWAGDLARNTQDVAAVVNRIAVRESPIWDLTPVWSEMEGMWRRMLTSMPYILLGFLVLTMSFWAAGLGARISGSMLASRVEVPLLRDVLSRAIGAMIFIFGIYFVLRIYGLTRLAVTVLGGTGLIGLVLGIAFRDISENFLASVFLSIQRPFRIGDLVQITTETGYVQRLNSRTTTLMTLDGNYVQIPNATVYKSPITNFMSNPNRRESFVIAIGYREIISEAQALAFKILVDHPAVLKDPEPWVLVDGLTPELIQLKVYYWINGRDHSFVKVRSSLIRLIKMTFQEHGIRLPAAPAAAVAANQLTLFDAEQAARPADATPPRRGRSRERSVIATRAEGGLESEERELQTQAEQARPPEDGQDLLEAKDDQSADQDQEGNSDDADGSAQVPGPSPKEKDLAGAGRR